MKKIVAILILAICCVSLYSQEVVIDCGNPALSDYSARYFEKYGFKVATSDTLELPFFDDFSASYMYPDSSKWSDKYAFINSSCGKNPISIGVATLDALNEYGNVYPTLPFGMSDVSDFLTSKPINLQRNASDSIYLSFFYQCGGNGDVPEFRDSQLYNRMAVPFSTFILTIIGFSLSVIKRRGGLGVNILLGLLLSFSYILFQRFSTTFALSGFLSPMLAVWVPNFIFAIIAVIVYFTAARQ